MSSIIRDITLINWFNYKGGGFVKGNKLKDENRIEFSPGTNVLVGTNNAGKTKLHNAFRYILKNEVILKVEKEGGKTSYDHREPKDPSAVLEIFNKSAFRELKPGEKGVFGVVLTFEKHTGTPAEPIKVRQIRKTITVTKKDDNQCESIEEKKQVFQVNQGGARLLFSEPNQVKNHEEMLIPNLERDFFLVEGEQMGMMTPLKGEGLKSTINRLTRVAEIQNKIKTLEEIKRLAKSKISSHQSSLKNKLNLDQAKLDRKKILEEQITSLEDNLEGLQTSFAEISSAIESTRLKYEKSKKSQELLDQLNELQEKVGDISEIINNHTEEGINNLTDSKTFTISKMFNNLSVSEKLNEMDNEFRKMIDERRIEMDKNLSDKHKQFLGELVTSQPSPTILRKMIDQGVCFVCSSDLEKKNKEFINNVLIPAFEGVAEEGDSEIQTIKHIKDSFKTILEEALPNLPKDKEYFTNQKSILEDLVGQRLEAEQAVEKFIDTQGSKQSLESVISPEIIAETAQNNIKKGRMERDIELVEKELKEARKERDSIENELKNQTKDEKSKKLTNLKAFIDDLDIYFDTIKTEVYKTFATKLEEKATARFRSFMKNNKSFAGHKLRVDVTTRENVVKQKKIFDLEVFLENERGEKLTQEGGASSTFEPLSLVFGLIDYAGNKMPSPFIADAPISRVTNDTKEAFFETIMEDSVLSQNILICMDLWDNKTSNITPLAEEVLKMVKEKNDASFITLKPKPNNTGVDFEYIKK